jgi:acetyltransferase-like isoleucine patch superfamily enzyme
MLLARGGEIALGDCCSVNPYTILYGKGGLTIGNNVRIAAHCTIMTSSHNFADINIPIKDQGLSSQGVIIEDDVWIGAGVRVLDGVRVARGAIIGAGTVITRNVEPLTINAGVPSRVINVRGVL